MRSGQNPIWCPGLQFAITAEDSKAINSDPRPKVILSASGMCDAGRIRHHLKHNLWIAENIILIAGYQSKGTLGRALLDGVKEVRLFGEDIAVNAEIAVLHGTSGHADQKGLFNWVEAFAKKPETIFVNHGDTEACEAFQALLQEKGMSLSRCSQARNLTCFPANSSRSRPAARLPSAARHGRRASSTRSSQRRSACFLWRRAAGSARTAI
ncbi:MAG: MBL fold metallo-hydrolase RNA specificity domain-containing protein [Oscillospiraceae bacterium]